MWLFSVQRIGPCAAGCWSKRRALRAMTIWRTGLNAALPSHPHCRRNSRRPLQSDSRALTDHSPYSTGLLTSPTLLATPRTTSAAQLLAGPDIAGQPQSQSRQPSHRLPEQCRLSQCRLGRYRTGDWQLGYHWRRVSISVSSSSVCMKLWAKKLVKTENRLKPTTMAKTATMRPAIVTGYISP